MNDCLITTETSRLLKSNSSTRFRAYENEIWEIPDAISNTVQQYHQLTKLANTFQTINLTIVIRTRFNGEENFARPLILHVLIKKLRDHFDLCTFFLKIFNIRKFTQIDPMFVLGDNLKNDIISSSYFEIKSMKFSYFERNVKN